MHFTLWLALLPLASALAEDSPEAKKTPETKTPDRGAWVFSLLPKSFQKNPYLELTVITEMTEEGKKLPAVSSAAPAFYQLQSGGRHTIGDHIHHHKPLTDAEAGRLVTGSLARRGYRAANTDGKAPTLAIFYSWGEHSLFTEPDGDNLVLTPSQVAANLLDRARLVGGEKFARKMNQLFHEADDQVLAVPQHFAPGTGLPPVGAGQQVFLNPVALYRMQNAKNEFLVDQASDDIFYVIVSAYDFHALQTKQRKLLWRTTMTVSADGQSEELALPAVIASAGPYFGKEMAEAETMTRRAVREGQVEVGTPTVTGTAPATTK